MTTPTPSAHSGEQGKPSDRPRECPFLSEDEAGRQVIEWWNGDRKLTLYLSKYDDPLCLRVWGTNIEEEMSESAILTDANMQREWDWLFPRELERKHEQSESVGEVVVTRDAAGAIIAVTRQDGEGRILSTIATAPPPSEQAGISDEVLEIAEGKFDSVYEAQYFLDGTTDNKRAALAEVLKWYESAFPRGVAGGGELERDAVDLATYRWLREHSRFCNDSLRELWFDQCVEADGSEFDRAVHAAIAEHSRGRGVE